ncbi:MAG: hypothetical protein ACTJHT_14890 [Sphingobacterium sp.]|uniref:hypothetical protein n=1 Tax=Sphingobacterium sp. JB170 TaxID=1434842 RepID=UPI00097EB0A7|nr:hypothetical protein [Sphingobacterium sp. JB170]SJN48760.1 hypothetical protein FM107_17620 [Sphingobacterium sp. JB170]
MNNTFVFSRLVRLINRQWIGFGKIYLMALGIIAGIFVAFFSFRIYQVAQSQNLEDISTIFSFRPYLFTVIGMAFLSIVSSSYFSVLGQKSKAITEILIPASRTEKFISALFYTALLTTVSYVLLFYIIDFSFVSYVRSRFEASPVFISPDTDKGFNLNRLNYFFQIPLADEIYWLLFLPFLSSAVFLLGSIYFNNFQFIKTAIIIVVYGALYAIFMVKIMEWYTSDTVSIVTDSGAFFNQESNIIKSFCTVGILVTLLIWGISFLRLKEKEV